MEQEIILRAEFNPRVCTYWLLSGVIILLVSIVGIPLIPLWLIGGMGITRRYLSRMECVLTANTLKVSKGILVRVEKTIPLEKITDLGMVQGPIMRKMDLHKLSIETAGQSGTGALVSLTGIKEVRAFRKAVLNQRDALSSASLHESLPSRPSGDSVNEALLVDIRDALIRIEALLKQGNGDGSQ